MRISEELRMAAAGQERTWQAKLELRAADEIEQLEKRVKELEQAKARNENDPEMAFDDELGWLHKDSLAGVNELRKRPQLKCPQDITVECHWPDCRLIGCPIWNELTRPVIDGARSTSGPTQISDQRSETLLKTLYIWKDVSNAPAEISPGAASP